MTDKPTGVFVRLPLSEDDCTLLIDASSFGAPDDSHDKALLAIGTPATGRELEVVGWAHGPHVKDGQRFYCIRPQDKAAKIRPYYDTALVRQSDALAKLAERYHAGWVAGKRDAHLSFKRKIAEKDAEIARLKEELQGFRAGLSDLAAKEVAALKGPEA